MPTGEMIAISTHRFNAIIDDPKYETIVSNKFRLYNNYPNPFNPYTNISYDIKEWSIVGLTIFDLLGRRIMEFEKRLKAPWRYTTQWYSKNDLGLKVPSGIYFYQLAVQDPITGRNLFTKTEKNDSTKIKPLYLIYCRGREDVIKLYVAVELVPPDPSPGLTPKLIV